MSALTEKTLARIAEGQIRPIPGWHSQWRNIAYWSLSLLLVLFAALATALSFHALFEIDWDAYAKADFSFGRILLSGVPLFSTALLILFLWGGTLLLQQTRRGYRYQVPALFGVFFLVSSMLGYFVEGSSLDEPAERFFLYAIPHAEEIQASLLPSAKRQWSQPERGLLGGSVLSSDGTDFQLIDASQKLWTVGYSSAALGSVSLEPYEQVKVIGNQEGEDAFRAYEIRSWEDAPLPAPVLVKENSDDEEKNRIDSPEKKESEPEDDRKDEDRIEDDEDKDEVKNDTDEAGDEDEERDREDSGEDDDSDTENEEDD